MQWLVLSELFLPDREILNGLAVHLIWSFGTYTEPRGFEKKLNVVYATNIPEITIFAERLQGRILRKYNFMNSFNVKHDCKRYKVLRRTSCVWKMQTYSTRIVCMLSNPMMNCGTNFLNTFYIHMYHHTYIYTYVRACLRACVRVYVRTYIHKYIHT